MISCVVFSCSNNPVDQNASGGGQAKGKIAVICKSASSVTAKLAATERADIWIWKTLDSEPAVYALEREGSSTVFNGAFEVEAGSYARVTVKGYAKDNTVTYFGSETDIEVKPGETTEVIITLIKRGDTTDIGGMKFALIPDGTFTRYHLSVTVSGFEMGIYEVTNGAYCDFLNLALKNGQIEVAGDWTVKGTSTSPFNGKTYIDLGGSFTGDNRCWITYSSNTFSVETDKKDWPVVYVTWFGAKAFALFNYLDLPTEAEWEYACKGGMQYEYGSDDGTIDGTKANYDYGAGAYEHPVDVGRYPMNPFGLFDMSGNVSEWCHDWYDNYPVAPQFNPSGPASSPINNRIFRGGSWHNDEQPCRSYWRDWVNPNDAGPLKGFRVVHRDSPMHY